MIKKKSRKKLITNFNMYNKFLKLFFYYLNKLLNSLWIYIINFLICIAAVI